MLILRRKKKTKIRSTEPENRQSLSVPPPPISLLCMKGMDFLSPVILFLYFFTTSIDLLYVEIGIFRGKISHILSLCLLGLLFLYRKSWRIDRNIFLVLFATVCSVAISICFSPMVYRSIGYLGVYLFTLAVYFLLPYNLVHMYGRHRVLRLYRAAFYATGIFAMYQFFASFFGIRPPFAGQFIVEKIARGQAMTYEPSYYALYMTAFVMYYNALYLCEKAKLLENQSLIRLIGVNTLLLVSTSTGAFFAYFAFAVIVIGTSRLGWVKEIVRGIFQKFMRLVAFLTLFFVAIAFAAREIFIHTFWKFFVVGFFAHPSFRERWEGIVNTWRVFLEHPIFGVGVGGVGPLLYEEVYFGGKPTEMHQPTIAMLEKLDPTNVLSELLACVGIVGCLAFTGFFVLYFQNFRKTIQYADVPEGEQARVYAFFVSVLVVLLVLQFNQNLFRSYVWTHLGLILGYLTSLREEYGARAN